MYTVEELRAIQNKALEKVEKELRGVISQMTDNELVDCHRKFRPFGTYIMLDNRILRTICTEMRTRKPQFYHVYEESRDDSPRYGSEFEVAYLLAKGETPE